MHPVTPSTIIRTTPSCTICHILENCPPIGVRRQLGGSLIRPEEKCQTSCALAHRVLCFLHRPLIVTPQPHSCIQSAQEGINGATCRSNQRKEKRISEA